MKSLNHLRRALLQLAAGFGIFIAALTACFYAVSEPSAHQVDQLLCSGVWAFTILCMALYFRFGLWLNNASFGGHRLVNLLRQHLHCNDIAVFFVELGCIALLFVGLLRLLIFAVSVFGYDKVILPILVILSVGLIGLILLPGLFFWWDWRASRNRSTVHEDRPC